MRLALLLKHTSRSPALFSTTTTPPLPPNTDVREHVLPLFARAKDGRNYRQRGISWRWICSKPAVVQTPIFPPLEDLFP